MENMGQRLTKTTLIVASCMLGPFWLPPPFAAGHTASSRGQAHVDILFLARINCQPVFGIRLCYRRSAARLPRWWRPEGPTPPEVYSSYPAAPCPGRKTGARKSPSRASIRTLLPMFRAQRLPFFYLDMFMFMYVILCFE